MHKNYVSESETALGIFERFNPLEVIFLDRKETVTKMCTGPIKTDENYTRVCTVCLQVYPVPKNILITG